MVFSVFTKSSSSHRCLVRECFNHPQRNPVPSAVSTNLLSVSIRVSILDISYKWNPKYVVICVWLLSSNNVFKSRRCCGMHQYFMADFNV